MTCPEFIANLLHASTSAHMLHLTQTGRETLSDDSQIQNTIDEIERLVSTAHYKLTVLS